PSQPVCFAGLASQKNYMSLYLMCLYGSQDHLQWFRREYAKAGKKLDMGKSCVRFKTIDDLPLDIIGDAIKRVPAKTYVALCEAALAATRVRKSRRSRTARRAATAATS